MKNRFQQWFGVFLGLLALSASTRAEDTLFWNTNASKVTADIRTADFFRVLQGVSAATGWKVFVEPETAHRVSAKFKDLAPGDALHLLFGDVNFALLPGTNGSQKLFVFRPREITSGAPPPPHLELKPPSGSDRIIVGLPDTAVQALGNGLDAFLQKQLSVAGEATLDPNSPSHGTAMAETILRSLQSITKGSTSVQILPVDVYGPNESTSTFVLADGIATAVNKGANPINLSLGSPGESPLMHDLITEASGKGIVFIGAAGNEPVTTPFYPAAYPEVLAVTALDQGQLAPYANRGSFVSLAAPGTSVVYYNDRPYYVMGTSASAAYLSGALAGYEDSTHSTAVQGKTFLGNSFSFKPGGK